MQAWASFKHGSTGITFFKSDLLTLRGSIEFDTSLKALHLRFVALGITLWFDAYFSLGEYGVEDVGFGWHK